MITFKPHHGTPFQKFGIFRVYPTGMIKRIGQMLAPSAELAAAKAQELWRNEPTGCTLSIETAAQTQARYQAGLKRTKK
jgi:hypothetical protein